MPEPSWIPWEGGPCPVNPGTMVYVRLRDGKTTDDPRPAQGFRWGNSGAYGDIVAYRLA